MRKIPLNLILASAALLAIFHALGTYFYIYWREPGFDWIVHFLGGFFVTITLLYVAFAIRNFPNIFVILTLAVLFALAVGIAWEVFEVDTGAAIVSLRGYWSNTAGDILFDIIGSLMAVSYVYVSK